MLTPFRFGLGGRLGSGKQWMSWVARDDVIGLMVHAAANEHIAGPVNVVAPNPVRNLEFTKALGAALHRPTIFPMPAAVLRLAVGEFGQIILASQKVLPRAALASGYRFAHPDIAPALRSIVE
jgi:uncharacterized protein (TIGR01777 family)